MNLLYNYNMNPEILIFILLILCLIQLGVLMLFLSKGFNDLHKNDIKLYNIFKNNIEPQNVTFTPEVKNLVSLSNDIWRFSKHVDKNNDKLVNLSERLIRGLDKFDIKITDFTGQKISEDLNVKSEVIKNDSSLEDNYVISTESPAIFYKDKMYQQGFVLINKINKSES